MLRHNIDVHILTLPEDDKRLLDRAIASCSGTIIHVCEGIIGDIGEARKRAFQIGSNKFVSYVDPDDYVLPGAFEACLDMLDKHPELDMAWTFEQVVNIDGRPLFIRKEPHHLCVWRREAIERKLDTLRGMVHPERAILDDVVSGGTQTVGYVYTKNHNSSWRRYSKLKKRGLLK